MFATRSHLATLLLCGTLAAAVATASGCGASAPAAHAAAPSPAASSGPSATELFASSCAAFSPDDAIDAIFNGFDDQDKLAARIQVALAFAKDAAAADPVAYGQYAREFQRFAEGMGQFIATLNDPFSTPDQQMIAIGKVPIPGKNVTCPPPAPDSAGLPLPSSS